MITVGGTKVSINEYRLAYDRQVNAMSQQFGQRLTREQATAFGLDNQVLAQLVSGALLDEQARKLGLGLSKDRLADLTREDPAFQGTDGTFDRRAFDYVLNQVGMRPEDYLNNRAQVAVRQQIVEAVADGLKAPNTFLKAVGLYRGEDRTIDYLVLPKSLVEPIEAPTDAASFCLFRPKQADLCGSRIPQVLLCAAQAGRHHGSEQRQRRTGQGRVQEEQGALHARPKCAPSNNWCSSRPTLRMRRSIP